MRRLALSFGLKSAGAIRRRSPTSVSSAEQPIDRGVDQGIVADVIELRLHFLPIVRGHQRKLLVQPAQRRQDALVQLLDHVGVQQQPPRRADRHFDQFASLLQLGDQLRRLVGADVGAAHQVGLREAAEAAEPGDRQGALLGVAGPEPLDALEHLEMPAANLLGDRLQHLAAAERLRRRRAADDERLAPGGRRRLFEEELRQAPLARLDGVAIEQRRPCP